MTDNSHVKGTYNIEHGSFRDRSGKIYYYNNAVYRGINQNVLDNWNVLRSTKFFQNAAAAGKIIHTENVDPTTLYDVNFTQEWPAVLKHDVIPFVSYPYEWTFGMLKDAALLHLELLNEALDENMILKDSTSFNIQWRGAKPVFIDIPSFEQLVPHSPWTGYLQFCKLFLYPLFLQAYKNIDFQPWLRGNIDGLEPEEMRRLMSFRDMFRAGVFTDVYLHAKMQAEYARADKPIKKDLQSSGFTKQMIKANVQRLTKIIRRLQWKQQQSVWANYANTTSYSDKDSEQKVFFVENIVKKKKRNLVWDLGCNTGRFSKIAAGNAQYVVAMDSDHLAVEFLYRELKSENNTTILPLVLNLANASPNLGWRGLERKAITERGKPDLILSLALIHHIVISANIPVHEFLSWLASLGSDLLIEFVTKQDPMVKVLLRNKDDQYDDYELENFRRVLASLFTIAEEKTLSSGTRILFYAEARKNS